MIVAASLVGAGFAALTPVAGADVTFQPPVTYAAAAGTQDVAVGDFDGDGRADIAAANAAAQSISVLLGNGDGGFQPATSVPVTGAPERLSVADFDADGNPDLAVAVPGANKVDVVWGSDGGFTGATTSVLSPTGAAKAIGTDLNGDGRDDLAVVDGGFRLSAYTSDPLVRGFTATTTEAIGIGVVDVAPISNVNATSHDVVSVLYQQGGVRVTFGNGTGGLADGRTYGVGGPDDDTAPNGVAVADITGDGRHDAVTSNGGTGNVTILTHSDDGLLHVQRNTALDAGFGPTGVATGDFTGDGTADAVVVGGSADAVTVLRSGGEDTPMVTVGSYPAGADPIRAAGADFNGDGAADLAVASTTGNVRVLLSQGHPTLAGQASASVTVGGTLSDTATLSGATPNATGTVTFRLYGPGDTTCATPLTTQTQTVSGNGAYTTPTPFGARNTGTYRWVTSYSGDDTNDEVDGSCSDANQTTVVAKATPSTSVSATSSVTVGTGITPEITLSGGHGPTGSLSLRAYATSDCSGSPAFTSGAITVNGAGTYPSDAAFTPAAAGTYRWTASYTGDDDNAGVTTTCGAATTTVAKLTPQLALSVPTPIVFESYAVPPTATLTGGYAPGGTVSLTAYTDETCTGTPAYVTNPITVSGNGEYSPPANQFVPNAAGTYRWVARYSGDGGNEQQITACGAVGTTLVVLKRTPTITAVASPAITVGDPAPATATLAGSSWMAPGQITLSAYATEDCSGPPAYVSDPVSATGDGAYDADPEFVPPHAGTYRWVAEYAGDNDNEPAMSACGATGSVTEVAPVTPTVTGTATSATLGDPVHASATLSATTEDAGGTITFTAYADAECAGPAAFTGDPVAVDGSGEYASDPFAPDAPGDYRWVARYSGDGDNAPAVTDCGATAMTSTIAPRPVVPQPVVVAQPPAAVLPPVLVPDPVVMLARITTPRCLSAAAPGRGSIRFGVSSRSRVTFTVQRRVNSPWRARTTCPRPLEARLDGTIAGQYLTVRHRAARVGGGAPGRPLRRTVVVDRGTHRLALRTLLGPTRLAPGRYRVLIQARSAAGATTRSVAYLWVLRPRATSAR